MFEDSESRFLALMIASEIVITLIAFVGAYYIFKPLLKPNDIDELGDSLLEDDKQSKLVELPEVLDDKEDVNNKE